MLREGEITVRLTVQRGQIASVDVRSTRGPLPARLTRGRRTDEVAQVIPLLFSVCARAQGAASSAALEAADGQMPDFARQAERSRAVRSEIVIELLTRLLIDWPRALGLAPEVAAVARLRQASAPALQLSCAAAARDHVFGVETESWLATPTLSALSDWTIHGATLPARVLRQIEREALDLGRSPVRAMPSAEAGTLLGVVPPLDDEAYAASPTWHGEPVETGPLARRAQHALVEAYSERHGNTVAARFVAQLVDLALWLGPNEPDTVRAHEVAPGVGLGLAETARGLLLHQAEVRDGRVQRYRIVAPTEWNFHADGALRKGLLGRAVADGAAASHDASLLAQALDPCVAFAVEVSDA
ncbi:MAG TPA: nickel-dependent hydrogenase large subunit [Burkholderiaceae bacterium]|nr:nickel-dependent hydrogenase large subunit [Burkholderiaceae bacterium]